MVLTKIRSLKTAGLLSPSVQFTMQNFLNNDRLFVIKKLNVFK